MLLVIDLHSTNSAAQKWQFPKSEVCWSSVSQSFVSGLPFKPGIPGMSFPTWVCQVISLYALKPIWRDLELCWDCSFTIFRLENYLRLCANNILKMAQRWITDQLRLEGTSEGHLDQPYCSNRATLNQLPRITSGYWIPSMTENPQLLQATCLPSQQNQCFLMFSFCPLPLALSQVTTEKNLS